MPNRQYLTAEEFRTRKFFSMPNRQYDNTVLDEYLQIATANVEAYTERIFAEQTYTEKFQGDGSTTYLAYQYPITEITSLNQVVISDGSTSSADLSKLIRTGQNDSIARIALSGNDVLMQSFRGDAIFTLVYKAGFASVPPVVKHATGLWCAELLRGDYGNTTQAPEVMRLTSQQIVELLNPIRRRRI